MGGGGQVWGYTSLTCRIGLIISHGRVWVYLDCFSEWTRSEKFIRIISTHTHAGVRGNGGPYGLRHQSLVVLRNVLEIRLHCRDEGPDLSLHLLLMYPIEEAGLNFIP